MVNILFEGLDHNHANYVNNEWPLLSCNKIHQPPGCLWATGFDLCHLKVTGFDEAMKPLSCLWATGFDLCHPMVIGFDLGGPWATGFDKAMNPLSCLGNQINLCHPAKVTRFDTAMNPLQPADPKNLGL